MDKGKALFYAGTAHRDKGRCAGYRRSGQQDRDRFFRDGAEGEEKGAGADRGQYVVFYPKALYALSVGSHVQRRRVPGQSL